MQGHWWQRESLVRTQFIHHRTRPAWPPQNLELVGEERKAAGPGSTVRSARSITTGWRFERTSSRRKEGTLRREPSPEARKRVVGLVLRGAHGGALVGGRAENDGGKSGIRKQSNRYNANFAVICDLVEG